MKREHDLDRDPEAHSPLLRFLALNSALGAAVGVAVASLLLLTNFAGLNDLLVRDGQPYVALVVLYAPFMLTSAGVVTGIAVMRLPWGKPCDMRDPEDDTIDPRGGDGRS